MILNNNRDGLSYSISPKRIRSGSKVQLPSRGASHFWKHFVANFAGAGGRFFRHVHEALNAYRDLEDLDERCIYLATGNHAIMFALTYNELLQLGDILSHTLLMMQVEKALR